MSQHLHFPSDQSSSTRQQLDYPTPFSATPAIQQAKLRRISKNNYGKNRLQISNANPSTRMDRASSDFNLLKKRFHQNKVKIISQNGEASAKNHRIVNQALDQIYTTNELFRQQMNAAHDERSKAAIQNLLFQKQIKNIQNQKEIVLADAIDNQARAQILQHQLFMTKDSYEKYKKRSQMELANLNNQVNVARAQMNQISVLNQKLNDKIGLLPIQEQKILQYESKIEYLSQQIIKINQKSKQFEQESNQFQKSCLNLTESIKNIQEINKHQSSQLSDRIKDINRFQMEIQVLKCQNQQKDFNITQIIDEKNVLISQKNRQISILTEQIKVKYGVIQLLKDTLNENMKYHRNKQQQSLKQLSDYSRTKELAIELQKKNSNIVQQNQKMAISIKESHEKIMNLQNIIKLHQTTRSKEEDSRMNLIYQLDKTNKYNTSKIQDITISLLKTQQKSKQMIQTLYDKDRVIIAHKQIIKQLNQTLQQHTDIINSKNKNILELKSVVEIQKAKSLENSKIITLYQTKLKSLLNIHQQTQKSNTEFIEQKISKITHLHEQMSKLTKKCQNLEEALSNCQQDKFTLNENAIILIKQHKLLIENLQGRLEDLDIKNNWLQQQNTMKEQILFNYNNIAEELRQKIMLEIKENNQMTIRNQELEKQLNALIEAHKEKENKLSEQQEGIRLERQKLATHEATIAQQNEQLNKISTLKSQIQQQSQSISQQLLQKTLFLSEKSQEIAKLKKLIEDQTNFKNQLENSIKQLTDQYQNKLNTLQSQNKRHQTYSNNINKELGQTFKEKNQLQFTMLIYKTQTIELQRQIQILKQQTANQIQIYQMAVAQLQRASNSMTKQREQDKQHIQKLTVERQQLSKVVEEKAKEITSLKRVLIEQEQELRNNFDEANKLAAENVTALTKKWYDQKEDLNSKVKQGNMHLEKVNQLLVQIDNYKCVIKNLEIDFQGSKLQSLNQAIQNESLHKSLKQMHQSLTNRQLQLNTKSLTQQQSNKRYQSQIQQLTSDKQTYRKQLQQHIIKMAQKQAKINMLTQELERLNYILSYNSTNYKAQIDYLRKANQQLKNDCSYLTQQTQNNLKQLDQHIAVIRLYQQKNNTYQNTIRNIHKQIETTQVIVRELKEQRDQLNKKFAFITHQVQKSRSKQEAELLNRELSNLTQYSSKVNSLHNQIHRHFSLIQSQLSSLEQGQLRRCTTNQITFNSIKQLQK